MSHPRHPRLPSQTPSFVCEVPLQVTTPQERVILVRLESARQLYNVCLGEAKRRVGLVRQSKVFQRAHALPKDDPDRARLFAQARARYDLSDYALQAYAGRIRQSWIGEHLDSLTAQKLASRAYQAANKLLLGQAKRVRFKGRTQLDSVEGKNNESGIRWRGDHVAWNGLVLPGIIDSDDPVLANGLAARVKYVRIVRRKLGDRNRFYAQLVVEGRPLRKDRHPLGAGIVGLDLGPKTIAVVSEQYASLQQFCPDVLPDAEALRRLDRKLDRQRRANNPGNYDERGRVKRGKLRWHLSRRQRETQVARREQYRKLAATRKRSHGTLVHQVLALGSTFHLEKLSYKAWQKRYGKSVGLCAPGMYVAHLTRLAASAGGQVVDINPRRAKLSQTCHCGAVVKKRLSQRQHHCPCGASAQRDLMSAFLARFVDPETSLLNAGHAKDAWPGAEPLLQAAFEQATQNQPASGRGLPSSFGAPRVRLSQSRSPAADLAANAESRDAVPMRKRVGRARQRQR